MSNRRLFIKHSIAGLAVASLPTLSKAAELTAATPSSLANVNLRFAIISDGHYGQAGTEYKKFHQDMVGWLNQAHAHRPLDFVIINGDLVHDQPHLLAEVKSNYYDKFKFPFYAVPGNHDHADTATWKSVFGYEDNFSFEKKGVGFVLANTSNTEGKYLCPNNDFIRKKLDQFSFLKTVFVVLHIPPHLWMPDNVFVECPETIDLLHQYANVKAVFHGHDHSLDSVFYTKKLPHFFDSHIGGNWGTTYRGYRIVEVGDDHQIQTQQINASANPTLNQTKI